MLWWTRIKWVASITIAIGLFFVIYLVINCFKSPENKNRQRNLSFLCLILIHQVVSSYFPDKNIHIPILEQHLLLILTHVGFLPFCIFYVQEEFRSIREKESQTRATDQDFEEKKTCIQAMNDDLVEKESRIQILTDALAEKDLHIQAINHSLEETRPTIQALSEADLENSRLRKLLEATEAEKVRNQKANALSMKKQIAKKDAEILHHRNLLETTQIEQKNNAQSANQIIAEKDAEILRLQSFLEVIGKNMAGKNEWNSPSKNTKNNIPTEQPMSGASFEENCKKHLTKAQADIIKLVNEGFKYEEIARMHNNVTASYIKDTMSTIGKRLKVRGKANILRKLNGRFQ